MAVRVSPTLEEAALHAQARRTLAHGAGVSALTHQQLYGREERGLARARLSREHGKAACGLDGGVMDEGHVLDVHLVDHRCAA